MSLLFEIKGRQVLPKPEVLLTEPFKTIWERDETEKKNIAIMEMSYAEFVTSEMSSSPYSGYQGQERIDKIMEQTVKPVDPDWVPDSLVREAVEYLREMMNEGSYSYKFYLSAIGAAEKVRDFFETFDMNERNERTKVPIFKAKEILDAVSKSTDTLETMNKLKQKVRDEIYATSRMKSKKVISEYQK